MATSDTTDQTTTATAAGEQTARALQQNDRTVPWDLRILTSIIRALMTDSPQQSRIGRLGRAIMLVPVFGVFLILAHIRMLLGRPATVTGQMSNGCRFPCTLPDLIQMYVYLFGVWEPDISSYIQQHIKPGDGFIDVGANIGYDTLLAAGCAGNRGPVVAIEASPAIYAQLCRNLRENNCEHVRVVNNAVTDKPGTLKIYSGPAHNVGLTSTVQRPGLTATAEIDAQPLPQLLTDEEIKAARLIKIDVEGGEDRVVAGMTEMLEHCRDDVEILIELSPRWWIDSTQQPEQVLATIRKAGFNLYRIDNNYWPWRYLWPKCVQRPQRIRGELLTRPKRIDLILSRKDAPYL